MGRCCDDDQHYQQLAKRPHDSLYFLRDPMNETEVRAYLRSFRQLGHIQAEDPAVYCAHLQVGYA